MKPAAIQNMNLSSRNDVAPSDNNSKDAKISNNSIRKSTASKYLLVGKPKGPSFSLDQERMDILERRIKDAANRICTRYEDDREDLSLNNEYSTIIKSEFSLVEGELNKSCPSFRREELTSSPVRAAQILKPSLHTMESLNTMNSSQTQPKSDLIQSNLKDGWYSWISHNNIE